MIDLKNYTDRELLILSEQFDRILNNPRCCAIWFRMAFLVNDIKSELRGRCKGE
jgi:hypothetical protein